MSESGPQDREVKIDTSQLGKKFMAILMDRVGKYHDMSAEVSQKTRDALFLDDRMGVEVLIDSVTELLNSGSIPPSIESKIRHVVMDVQLADPIAITSQTYREGSVLFGEQPEQLLERRVVAYRNAVHRLSELLYVILPEDIALELDRRKDDWIEEYLPTRDAEKNS